jgi:hypothetical protein
VKNGNTVNGSWVICTEETVPVCAGKIPSSDMVSPVESEQEKIYAYFKLSGNALLNYEQDLVVPVELTVDPRPIEITRANLQTTKTYDGTDVIIGSVTASNFSNLAKPADRDTISNYFEVTSAKYESTDAGDREIIMEWDWKAGSSELGNWKKKYELEETETKTYGYISQKEIIVSKIKVCDREYNGNTDAYFGTNKSDGTCDDAFSAGYEISGRAYGQNASHVDIDTDNFKKENITAEFISKNASYGGAPVQVAISVKEGVNKENLLKGSQRENYVLKIDPSEAVITPANMVSPFGVGAEPEPTITGTYGQTLSIRTSQWALSLPAGIVGVNSTRESVDGTWILNANAPANYYYLNKATAIGKEENQACDAGEYSEPREVYFRSDNSNYNDLPVEIRVCVKPLRLVMEDVPDFDLTGKIYDGTTDVVSKVTIGEPDNILTADDGKVKVEIDKKYYNLADAGNNRNITVTYKYTATSTEANTNNYLLPKDYTLSPVQITKRPVTLMGYTYGKRKYYDGEKYASDVDFSNAELVLAIAAGKDSGVVSPGGTKDNVGWNHENLTFKYSNTNVGSRYINITEYEEENSNAIKESFRLTGTKAGNYKFVMPEFPVEIYKASLANRACEWLAAVKADCGDIAKLDTAARNKLLRDDLAKGLGSETSKKLLNGKKLETVYGNKFSIYENLLDGILPAGFYDVLLGNEDDSKSGFRWAWEPSSADKMPEKAAQSENDVDIGYAYFYVGTNDNYEPTGGIPIPVYVKKAELWYSAADVTRPYEPGNKFVNLVFTPEGEGVANELEIIGIGEMKDDKVDNGKPLTITDIEIIRKPGYTSTNYATGDGNIRNYPVANITKATLTEAEFLKLFPAAGTATSYGCNNEGKAGVCDSLTYVHSTLSDARPPLNEWKWSAEDGAKQISASGNYTMEYHGSGFDSDNYEIYSVKVPITVFARSLNDALRANGIAVDGDCGADTLRLTIEPDNQFAQVWFMKDEKDNLIENPISGKYSFTATGLPYGRKDIEYGIKAQDYARPVRHAAHTHVRFIPFSKVVTWMRDKTLALQLDSAQIDDRNFFREYKIDPVKTEWYRNNTKLGTGRFISVSKEGDLSTDDHYSVILTAASNGKTEYFTSCKSGGGFPEAVPNMPGSSVKLIASSFGSRVVAGGTSLTLNTPDGGTVSVYTMKGELVSKMQAVDNRTVVRVPNTKGMYIVKLEAK